MVKKVFARRPLPRQTENLNDELVDDEELPEGGNKLVIGIFVVLVILGIGTGYLLSRKFSTSTSSSNSMAIPDGKKSVGVSDTGTFKDSATGTIEAGGLAGEGTHKLLRDNRPDQTVYIISSVVDLDQFVGKKVTVWGQTMAAKKVPWLMDVGRVDHE